MDTLRQQVAIAYRRLMVQRFVAVLAWSWFGTLLVAAGAIALAKTFPLGVDSLAWTISWIAGALVAGLLIAGIWTYFTRQSRLEAAIEIDRRFGLKERVSSTLALDSEELETDAGRALARDAVRRVERLDVPSQFGMHFHKRSLLPLIPAALAVGMLFVADPTRDDTAEANIDPVNVTKQIKESTEPLRKKLEERKKEAAEKGLKDAADLFKQLEEGARELTKKDNVDRKQALSKLTDLQKQLEERREKLGGNERMKQQLDNLKNLKSGPADKVADALKDGDFKKALDEIEKLKDQLDKGDLDDKAKEDLEKQLAEMQKKLQQAVDGQKKVENELQKQIAEAQKQIPMPEELKKQIQDLIDQGRKEDADKLKQQAEKMAQNLEKLQQQLGKMQQQGPQMQQLQDMANKLGQCAQCMGNGDKAGAKQALDGLQKELQQMAKQADELVMLDQALDQLAECKGECNGDGEKDGKGGKGMQGKGGKGKGGDGLGAGRGGFGERPIDKDGKVGFRDSHVSQNVGKGKAVITGEVDGPNMKGLVQQEIREQIEAAKREASDAVTQQRLPRSQRDHAKEYFDSLREGK
jgi:hypothetical protein